MRYCKYVTDSYIKYLSGSRTIYLFPLVFSALVISYGIELGLYFKRMSLLVKLSCMPMAPSTSLNFLDSFRLYLQRFWHVQLFFFSIDFCELTQCVPRSKDFGMFCNYSRAYWFFCIQSDFTSRYFGMFSTSVMLLEQHWNGSQTTYLVITWALVKTRVQLNLSIY